MDKRWRWHVCTMALGPLTSIQPRFTIEPLDWRFLWKVIVLTQSLGLTWSAFILKYMGPIKLLTNAKNWQNSYLKIEKLFQWWYQSIITNIRYGWSLFILCQWSRAHDIFTRHKKRSFLTIQYYMTCSTMAQYHRDCACHRKKVSGVGLRWDSTFLLQGIGE